jgi:hypothetical protein
MLQLGAAFRALMPLFMRYLLVGGFPENARLANVSMCQRLLREDVVARVLKRDMTALFGSATWTISRNSTQPARHPYEHRALDRVHALLRAQSGDDPKLRNARERYLFTASRWDAISGRLKRRGTAELLTMSTKEA